MVAADLCDVSRLRLRFLGAVKGRWLENHRVGSSANGRRERAATRVRLRNQRTVTQSNVIEL